MPGKASVERPASTLAASFPWLASRRDLLRVGSLALSTAVLPGLARRVQAGVAAEAIPSAKAKSVVFLWMMGGVTHIDSFDPKPEAPEEIRGTLGAIDTALPGVRFCETMPELARIADRLAVVRSFSHDSNDHFLSQAYGLSGRKVPMSQIMTEPNIGSVVSYLHGPRNQLPGYLAVPGITRPGPPPHNLFVGGWLGGEFGPFAVGGEPEQPDFTVSEKEFDPSPLCDENLQPQALELSDGVDSVRIGNREALRRSLDHALRHAERQLALGAMEGHYQNAVHLLSSADVRRAFDLAAEPAPNRDAYGRTKIGNRCLLACRLVEAGARFVMVDYGYDPEYGNLWDNHNAPVQNHPPIVQMVKRGYHLAGTEKAFAGLILDLERRGLLDSTLVVFMTEFGRTPKINAEGGRDHWGPAGSIFFAGGGTRAGQVIGATDKQAAYPVTRGYSPGDVAATIYRAVGIDASAMLQDRENRPHPVLPEGTPIPEVLG